MAWATPQYSKAEVDAAGSVLADTASLFAADLDAEEAMEQLFEKYNQALAIINNWRSSHSFPLNSLQVNLRHNAGRVYDGSLVAQRIKRLAAIQAKVRRFKNLRL